MPITGKAHRRLRMSKIRPINEASTRFAALASGQVDIVSGVPVELYDKILKNPKLEVVSRAARRSIFLALGNKAGSPAADIRVRKAMYMAINEDEIIEKIMRGHAAPAAQIPDIPTIGYNPDIKRLPYDPQKAKALLKEAGYADGFEITLTGPNDRYVQDAKIAEAVAKYLAKVGIKVNLDVKPKSIFFPEVAEGKLDFYLIGWFDGTFDMGRTYFKLAHTRDEAAGQGESTGPLTVIPKSTNCWSPPLISWIPTSVVRCCSSSTRWPWSIRLSGFRYTTRRTFMRSRKGKE